MTGDSLFTRVGQNVGQRTQRRDIFSLYSGYYALVLAERVGFEPTWALAPTDFESVPVWPHRYLSKGHIGYALCAATTSRTAHLRTDCLSRPAPPSKAARTCSITQLYSASTCGGCIASSCKARRRPLKKVDNRAPHSDASSPPITVTRWLCVGMVKISATLFAAPVLGSSAP